MPKSAPFVLILDTVRGWLQRGPPVSATRPAVPVTAPGELLSPTRIRALKRLLAGMSSRQIADGPCLALGKVRGAVSSIMLKLDARSRLHLISLFR